MIPNLSQINNFDYEKLISDARKSSLRRSRILIHENDSAVAQKMVIALFHDSNIGMHRHPVDKTETYIPLIGELQIKYAFSNFEEKLITSGANLSSVPPYIITHSNGIWHEPKSISEFCVYFEIYDGPFDKLKDVEYRDQI